MLSFREGYSEKLETKQCKNVLTKMPYWKIVFAWFESVTQRLMI